MEVAKYKRIMLKISGEALAGEKGFGIDFEITNEIALQIKELVKLGVEIGVVVQVTTQQKNKDGSYSVAEAITYIPNVKIHEEFKDGNIVSRKIKP